MGNTHLNIEYDREKFYAGQMVSGRVVVHLDTAEHLRAVNLTLKGEAECRWMQTVGNVRRMYVGEETLFETKINLLVEAKEFGLPIGVYVYPFSVNLPSTLPSSFEGKYGKITYRGKVKIDVPWAPDKVVENNFIVESLLNLNDLPEMNRVYIHEENKSVSCLCCAEGPLTLTVKIPRTAYVSNEPIPVMIAVDNASTIRINEVRIALHQIIRWRASGSSRSQILKLKAHRLGAVDGRGSKSWYENLWLGPNKYPRSKCRVLRINYELVIKLDLSGLYSGLKKRIPITIGDIPYSGYGEVMNQDNTVPPSAPSSPPDATDVYTPGPYPGWFCSLKYAI